MAAGSPAAAKSVFNVSRNFHSGFRTPFDSYVSLPAPSHPYVNFGTLWGIIVTVRPTSKPLRAIGLGASVAGTAASASREQNRKTGRERRVGAVPNAPLWHRVSPRIALIVVLAVLLTSGFSLYAAFQTRGHEISDIKDQTLRLARAAALFEDDMVQQTSATLSTLGSLPAIRDGDWRSCHTFLANELRSRPVYTNLGVINRRGIVVCSALSHPTPVRVSDRRYFVRVMATHSFSMGGYQVGRITGTPAVNFAAPVFDAAGRVKYVVFAALDLNWFNELAGRLQLPDGASLDVFSADGVILVGYPDARRWVSHKIPYADTVAAVQNGPTTTERMGLDGVRRIYGVTRLSVTPAYANEYLGVGIPVALALSAVRRLFLTNLALAGVVGLVAILLALEGAALYVQRPLDALTRAARRLAAGDLGARAGSAFLGGELRHVIGAFDDMASALERRTTALHDAQAQYRALVEQSIAGVAVLDAGAFLYVNDALAAIFGYRPDEMIGRLRPIDVVHPEDRAMVTENIRQRLQAGGHPMHYTCRGLRKDGSGVDVEVFGRSLVHQGRLVMMTTVLDVTAQKQARAQQVRRAAEREAFYHLSRRLRAARTAPDMYSIVVEQVKTLVGAAFVSLNLLDGSRRQLVRVHSSGTLLGGVEPAFPLAGSFSEPVIESGKSRVVDNPLTEAIPRRWEGSSLDTFGALAAIPVRTEDATIGTILAARPREPGGTPFTTAEVRQLEGMAEIGGIAIRRVELSDSLERRVQTLTALHGSAQRFAGNLDPGHLAADVVRTCVESFGMGMATLGCLSSDDAGLMAAHWPPDSEGLQTIAGRAVDYRKLDDKTCDAIAQTGVPLILQNLAGDREHPAWEATALAAGMRSAGLFPLVSRSMPFGVLALYSDQAEAFTSERVEFLTAYTHQAAAALQNARLFDDAGRHLRELEALNDLDRAVRGSLDLTVILQVLLDKAVTELKADAVDVLLLDPQAHVLSGAAARGFRSAAIRHVRLRLEDGYAGQVALSGHPVSIDNLNGTAESACGKYVAGEGFVSYHAMPLVAKGVVRGVLEVFHRSPTTPTQGWRAFFEALAGQTATAIDNVRLFDDLRKANAGLRLSYDQTIEGWSRALDLRDRETEGHSQRVTELTIALARAMGIAEADLVHIRRGALLHDIGKMGVPDAILLKPGPLTETEWEVMRRHPVYARELIASIAYLHPALDIPYSHHEKWDGTGYPQGLSGHQIPPAARIFAVVDVWDALRSDRPYRPAFGVEQARAYVREQSGRYFDPEIVEKFLELLDRNS